MPSLETLLQESVVELRIRFLVRGQCVPEGLLEALEVDSRVAARELARKIRSRRFRNRAEGQRLRNLLRFEVELWSKGISLIAGVDEAGMAPLAGPVLAGAADQVGCDLLGGGTSGGRGDRSNQHLPRRAAGDAPGRGRPTMQTRVRPGGRAENSGLP